MNTKRRIDLRNLRIINYELRIKQTIKKIIASGKNVLDSKVLVMGVTFKEDVSDIRNSRVADVIGELKSYGASVDVVDPHASSEELFNEYGFKLTEIISNNYDAVIIAVSHKEYYQLDENYFKSIVNENAIIIDVKGLYRGKIKNLKYWSL